MRAWKSRFAKGDQGNFLLIATVNETQLYCNVGHAGYYMGEGGSYHSDTRPPGIFTKYGPVLTPQESFDKYGIKIVYWEFSPPIVNSFK